MYVQRYFSNNDISVLGEGPTKELDVTAITTEAKYSISFT